MATAYPFPGCPYFVLYLLTVRPLYEGDGICPPRPPGSASRPRSLRHASSSSACSGACWWIPAGGEVLLCGHFSRLFLSNTPGRVPRYFLDYLGQGPAGGRRPPLRVSPSIRDSAFVSCRFSSFVRYGVDRCSWGVCVGSFCWSRAPRVGLLVVSLGLSLVCRVLSCPAGFICCAFRELRATTNGAVLRESQKLR